MSAIAIVIDARNVVPSPRMALKAGGDVDDGYFDPGSDP